MDYQIEIPDHCQRLSRYLYQLQQAGAYCDIDLECRDGTVPVHRIILISNKSSILDQKGLNRKTKQKILLKQFPVSSVRELIKCLYLGKFILQSSKADEICSLSVVFGLTEIASSVKTFLASNLADDASVEINNAGYFDPGTLIEGMSWNGHIKDKTNESNRTQIGQDLNLTNDNVLELNPYTSKDQSMDLCDVKYCKISSKPSNQEPKDEPGVQHLSSVPLLTGSSQQTSCQGLEAQREHDIVHEKKVPVPRDCYVSLKRIKTEVRNEAMIACDPVTNDVPDLLNDSDDDDNAGDVMDMDNDVSEDAINGTMPDDININQSLTGDAEPNSDKSVGMEIDNFVSGDVLNITKPDDIHTYQSPKGNVESKDGGPFEETHSHGKVCASTTSNLPQRTAYDLDKSVHEHDGGRGIARTESGVKEISGNVKGVNEKANETDKEMKGITNNADSYMYIEAKDVHKNQVSFSSGDKVKSRKNPQECTVCGKVLADPWSFKIHMRKHLPDNEKPFKCQLCPKVYTSNTALRAHMIIHTGDSQHKCEYCGRLFINNATLKVHTRVHLETECVDCGRVFNKRMGLLNHRRMKHSGVEKKIKEKPKKEFGCETCGKVLRDKWSLKIHVRKHLPEKPFKCSHCANRYTSLGAVRSHELLHTGDSPFRCDPCNKVFISPSALQLHISQHREMKCRECGLLFHNRNMLLQHRQSEHGVFSKRKKRETAKKECKCEECGKTLRDPWSLKIHRRQHIPDDEKPFKCDKCPKVYTSSSALKAHMRKHPKEKAHTCDVCEKAFTTKLGLITHKRTHKKPPSYNCDKCGRSSSSRPLLKLHVNVCKKVNPLVKTCGRNVLISRKLLKRSQQHLLLSSKLFTCNRCNKVMSSEKCYLTHVRLHRGVKPYTCDICDTSFGLKSTLVAHVQVHSDLRKGFKSNGTSLRKFGLTDDVKSPGNLNAKFKCNDCPKSFRSRKILEGHQKTHDLPFKCSRCDQSFKTRPELNQHNMLKHFDDMSHVCNVCGDCFQMEENLQDHIKEHHISYKCAVCNRVLSSVSQYRTHLSEHQEMGVYKCTQCQKEFPTAGQLVRHMEMHSSDRPYLCSVCGKSFKHRQDLRRHLVIHTGERAHVCHICGKGYRWKCDLVVHLQTHDDLKPYLCDTCGKKFKTKQCLSIHELTHTAIRSFKCKLCFKMFLQSSHLSVHMETHRNSNLSCEHCEKVFKTEKKLKDHCLRKHTLNKPFDCNICAKKFVTKKSLNDHVKMVHPTEKPFSCEVCGASFITKSILTNHMIKHSNDRPHECEVCGVTFKSKLAVKLHISSVHLKVKNYLCIVCNKRFCTKSGLNNHMVIHTDETQFKCNTCGKAFKRKAGLDIHIRTHTGETPFVCEVCEKRFSDKSNLKQHIKTHTGFKPHECGICHQQFYRKDQMQKHELTHI